MKVKCNVNVNMEYRLTVGKQYDVLNVEKGEYGDLLYKVLDDMMVEAWFYSDRFEIVED